MGLAVVTVASGGLPVTWTTAPVGLPVTEAANKFGLAVTQVAAGKAGLPVTYVTESGAIVSPLTPTTWNPADKAAVNLTNGNLTATGAASTTNQGVRAIAGLGAGKYYFEIKMTVLTFSAIGLCLSTTTLGSVAAGTIVMDNTGLISVAGSGTSTLGTRANNDVIGIATDLTGRLIWMRVAPAGNWNGSGAANPATGAGGVNISGVVGTLFPYFKAYNFSNDAVIANFGATAFSGTVPSGYTAGWG